MYKKIIIRESEIEGLKSKDNKMKMLIDSVGQVDREYIADPFVALVNSIVFQQLSSQAATTIWNKFKNYISELEPNNILQTSDEGLRNCGLSKRKITYIKNIAKAVEKNEIDFDSFTLMSDEEIIKKLIKIKGIGTWTAEMFLIFSLNRKNILSANDLGIRKGLQWLYGLKEEASKKQFERFKSRFSPYNTLASFYLWEITANDYHLKYDNIEEVNLQNNVAYFDSPIGLLEIQSAQEEIISLEFIKERRYEEKLDPLLLKSKKQLQAYFSGERREFDLPLRINGTRFQNKVWKELIRIPYGRTLSYKDVAVSIGNVNACRAVGNANNKNNIAIIIPCHRVVGSTGKIGGYGAGVWRKEWLLEHEKNFC
ncbi:methylated-DNA--[protein]-cysteine S-methyltransferase [Orenia marismortui]|uniref:Methylated-DNA--protein-cysteine methyltransferase n=1 Tax=Orenia marismortui TaxID=46469 RepID=A0A4R8H384_9FIRM|nr:methylated-DNA--[protein]-cysteine S-methyltransferase [Orenia marismortui]TDX49156.1 DNA-3-methyladenine glycosylase II [Orenia marismortui]